MRKNSLTVNKGLSLSQAQSISNLCNQRAKEIGNKLEIVNNYSKSVYIDNNNHILVQGNKLPKEVVELLTERAKLFATQAFLMENIKAKSDMIRHWKNVQADVSGVVIPDKPRVGDFDSGDRLAEVTEEYGWEQLKPNELNEYYEAEAFASHIGQFIHQNGLLDRLRKELPTVPSIDWIVIDEGKKTPVIIETHHTSEYLYRIHEELAAEHRKYEQRVNYYKAKVKNLTTEENARIAKHNADIQTKVEAEYSIAIEKYQANKDIAHQKIKKIKDDFEIERQNKIKEIASMRISVDGRFQDVVDDFLGKMSQE